MTTPFADPFADWWGMQDGWGVGQPPTTNNFTSDILADYLDEEPDIPFQGALSRANLTPNQYQTFRNQRQNIFGQFQAMLDNQLRQGQLPTGRFPDFADQFDFTKEFQRFAPGQRVGGGLGDFAPPVRYGRRA